MHEQARLPMLSTGCWMGVGLGCYGSVVGRTGTDSWDFGVGHFEADTVAAAVLTILLTCYDKPKTNDFAFHNLDISHP